MNADQILARLGLDRTVGNGILFAELTSMTNDSLRAIYTALETRDSAIDNLRDLRRRAEFARDCMDNAGDVMNAVGIAACCTVISEYVLRGS